MLVRSRTDRSLYTPHTGVMMPGNGTGIPAAAITVEDAHIIARHVAKGGILANGSAGGWRSCAMYVLFRLKELGL